jgi:hypothetical protein
MRSIAFTLAVSAVALTTVASGILHGRMRNRWGSSEAMQAAAASLQQIPTQFGHWRMAKSEDLDKATIDMLECEGQLVRCYTNEKTGASVTVLLILGPVGAISVHTPEICMSSQAFRQVKKRLDVAIPDRGADDHVWGSVFKSTDLRGELEAVYYGWSCGGAWQAAKDPRFGFAGKPWLYKVQVASRVLGDNIAENDDAGKQFLRDFLPAIKQYLAAEPSK